MKHTYAEAALPASHSFAFDGEPTDRSPETYQGSFLYTDTTAMLDALGVRLYPEDKVYAFPEPKLGIGSYLKVYRAQPVLIDDAGTQQLVRTWKTTVGDLLAEQGIEVGNKDVVEPKVSEKIALSETVPTISITRVAETEIKTTQPIDFTTIYEDDATLEKGVTKTTQAGQKGVLEKVYLVHRENGVEVSRRLTSQNRVKEPVNQVIVRGTKIVDLGSGGASWYGGTGAMTAAHKTLPFGTKVRVVNVKTGASVIVTINDRGPFVAGRVIDLSKDAFAQIASVGSGVATVRIEKAQ